jgi:hypothetical protein
LRKLIEQKIKQSIKNTIKQEEGVFNFDETNPTEENESTNEVKNSKFLLKYLNKVPPNFENAYKHGVRLIIKRNNCYR